MAYDPILDADGKELNLQDLVTEASTELMMTRRKEATNLIKSFLLKTEGLDREIKQLKNQLTQKEESLKKTQDKIERLRKGEWNILSENNSASKADSERDGGEKQK